MQVAIRLARHRAPIPARRCLATTANAHLASSIPSSSSSPKPKASAIPLSNVEAQWERLNVEDRALVHEQLEALSKKDWKELSIDEKKAAYYVSFGPHGPRAPVSKPGDHLKVFLGTMAALGVSAALFFSIRAGAPTPPRTINKEWQEASNERALDQKMNPLTGIASEGYKGKGFVQDN